MKGGGNSPKFEIIYVEGDATQPILKKLNLTGSHLGGSTRHVNGKKKHTHTTPLFTRERENTKQNFANAYFAACTHWRNVTFLLNLILFIL